MIPRAELDRPWRGLTLWQPWASLVATGHKRIETRSWGTKFRGVVAIHAAKKRPPTSDYQPDTPALIPSLTVEAMMQALGTGDFEALPRGAILALARLTNCVQLPPEFTTALVCPACVAWLGSSSHHQTQEHIFGDYQPGRWCWVLEDVARLELPYYSGGKQGLWKLQDVVVNWLKGCTLTDARIGVS